MTKGTRVSDVLKKNEIQASKSKKVLNYTPIFKLAT